MLKFIANYTLLPGQLLINNVVSIDAGRLVQCQPCDVEMANTRYIDNVLCLVPQSLAPSVEKWCREATTHPQFIDTFLSHTSQQPALTEPLLIYVIDPPYYNIITS